MVEGFGLGWPGKQAAAAQAAEPVATELVREPGEASAHRYYEGDNLEVLKHLRGEFADAVDVIYIDPPYNTGREFVYLDKWPGAAWLSMMYPRLLLARELLAGTGFIAISIGEREVARLRLLCDEVFGEDNFAGELIWKKAGTGKNDSKFAVVEHEYVLVYAKDASTAAFNPDPEGVTSTKYVHEDERGRYSLVRLDSKTLGYLPTLDYVITGPDGRTYSPDQPAGRERVARWRWSREKVAERFDDLVFRRGYVYTKNYAKPGARPRSILDGERFGVTRTGRRDAEEATGVPGIFEHPKPVRLISHLIQILGGRDAVVLDFFSGSGTTGQAVLELNAADGGTRRHIQVQLPAATSPKSPARAAGFERLTDIGRARLVGAGARLARPGLDTGLEVYTLRVME